MNPLDDVMDDLFHSSAFTAFVEEAIATGSSPCLNPTRERAYRLYEAGLAMKNGLAAPLTSD